MAPSTSTTSCGASASSITHRIEKMTPGPSSSRKTSEKVDGSDRCGAHVSRPDRISRRLSLSSSHPGRVVLTDARGQERARSSSPTHHSPSQTPTTSRLAAPHVLTPERMPTPSDLLNLARQPSPPPLPSEAPSSSRPADDRPSGSPAPHRRRRHEDRMVEPAPCGPSPPLPGMTSASAADARDDAGSATGSVRSSSPSRTAWARTSLGPSSIDPANSFRLGASGGRGTSVPDLASHRSEISSEEMAPFEQAGPPDRPYRARMPAMSPSQGRISPERLERPVSPTKGLGGFVQSAMLRRSDSAQKRWSTQSVPRLAPDGSIANLGDVGRRWESSRPGPTTTPSSPRSPIRRSQTDIMTVVSQFPVSVASSRPGHLGLDDTTSPIHPRSDPPGTTDQVSAASPSRSDPTSKDDEAFSKPLSPPPPPPPTTTTPPPSPTKTADSRRWSPQKASWLETALNMGPERERPRIRSPPVDQPTWMLGGAPKWKQPDPKGPAGRDRPFSEVKTDGLMRAPAWGGSVKPDNVARPENRSPSSTTTTTTVHPSTWTTPTADGSSRSPTDSSTHPPVSPLASPPADRSMHEAVRHLDVSIGSSSSSSTTAQDPSTELRETSPASGDAPADGQLTDGTSSVTPTTKPRPHPPPLKDFRSVLRSRQPSDRSRRQDEPEFKNVFGKLKHTTTQKYVAPDELKDNILRGKAGLNSTGGPTRPERRDELKESLLKQKEAIKVKSASERSLVPPRLERAGIKAQGETSDAAAAVARQKLVKRSTGDVDVTRDAAAPGPSYPITTPKLSRETLGRRRPSDRGGGGGGARPVEASVPLTDGSISNGFGQRLAGLLSKGPPPPRPSGTVERGDGSGGEHPGPASAPVDTLSSQAETPAALTHPTKGRARGPRRRLPRSRESDRPLPGQGSEPRQAERSDRFKHVVDPHHPPPPHPTGLPTGPPTTTTTTTMGDSSITDEAPSTASGRLRPAIPSDHQILMTRSQLGDSQTSTLETGAFSNPASSSIAARSRLTGLLSDDDRPSPGRNRFEAAIKPIARPNPSSLQDLPSQRTLRPRVSATQSPFLESRATNGDRPASLGQQSLRSSTSGGSVGTPEVSEPPRPTELYPGGSDLPASLAGRRLPSPPPKRSTLSAGIPLTSRYATPQPDSTDAKLPSPSTPRTSSRIVEPGHDVSQAIRLLDGFFENTPTRPIKSSVDVPRLLSAEFDEPEKIRTVRKRIRQIDGDGKEEAVPPHQEHILFQDHMYICTHYFQVVPPTGSSGVDVFFWVGDNVSEASVEDAQIFARKAAKASNGRLIEVRQGREPAAFFQALGGIIITRQGSSSRRGSNASFMLCGRRHLGHIAFDEVNFSLDSLCSGFPYIVCSPPRRVFLWKGKGSATDELGCARLIGMDCGTVGGELEEMDEGNETDGFLDVLGAGTDSGMVRSAAHWALKPRYERYRPRLFCITHEGAQTQVRSRFWSRWQQGAEGSSSSSSSPPVLQATEISPFCQVDLRPSHIYCLDAFFEIYV